MHMLGRFHVGEDTHVYMHVSVNECGDICVSEYACMWLCVHV